MRIDGVRVLVLPWLFRLPPLRRYDGYALHNTILLRSADTSEDLLTHELCHIWQSQQRPFRHFWTWLTSSYATNPDELEARRAAATTRPLSGSGR